MKIDSSTPTPIQPNNKGDNNLPPFDVAIKNEIKPDGKITSVFQGSVTPNSTQTSTSPISPLDIPNVEPSDLEFRSLMVELNGRDPSVSGGALGRLEEQISLLSQGAGTLSLRRFTKVASIVPKLLVLQQKYSAGPHQLASIQLLKEIRHAIKSIQSSCHGFLELWNERVMEEVVQAREHLDKARNRLSEPVGSVNEMLQRTRDVYEGIQLLRFLETNYNEANTQLETLKNELATVIGRFPPLEEKSWASKISNIAKSIFSSPWTYAQNEPKTESAGEMQGRKTADVAKKLLEEWDSESIQIGVAKGQLSHHFEGLDQMEADSARTCLLELEKQNPKKKELMSDVLEIFEAGQNHYSRRAELQLLRRVDFLEFLQKQSKLSTTSNLLGDKLKNDLDTLSHRLHAVITDNMEPGTPPLPIDGHNRTAIQYLILGERRFADIATGKSREINVDSRESRSSAILRTSLLFLFGLQVAKSEDIPSINPGQTSLSSKPLDDVNVSPNGVQPPFNDQIPGGVATDDLFEPIFRETVHAMEDAGMQFLVGCGNLTDHQMQDSLIPLLAEALFADDENLSSFIFEQMPLVEPKANSKQILIPYGAIPLGDLEAEENTLEVDLREVIVEDNGRFAFLCSFFSKNKNNNVGKSFKLLTSNQKSFCRLINDIKLISHSWEIKGSSTLLALPPAHGITTDIIYMILPAYSQIPFGLHKIYHEGLFSGVADPFILDSLMAFTKDFSGIFSPQELETVSFGLASKKKHRVLEHETYGDIYQSPEKLFEDYSKGKLINIDTGFLNHYVSVTLYGDYLAIANKGGASRRPIDAFKINKQKITVDTIRDIVNLRFNPAEIYTTWLKTIDSTFDTKINDPFAKFLNKAYPVRLGEWQIVGNCGYESMETSVFIGLLLERFSESFNPENVQKNNAILQKTIEDFDTWTQYTKIYSIETYLSRKGIDISKLTDAKISSLELDPALFDLVFSRAKNITWKPEFKSKIDNLEKFYLRSTNSFERGKILTQKVASFESSQAVLQIAAAVLCTLTFLVGRLNPA